LDYFIFDAHADTLTKMFANDALENKNAESNDCSVTIEELAKYPKYAQTFAIFIDKTAVKMSPIKYFDFMHKKYVDFLADNSDKISHCNNADDIKRTIVSGKTASILSVEGGEIIEGKIENLHHLYDCGVRMMALTWNFSNEIADGVFESKNGGLTGFGKDVVHEMENIGMIVDVSHASEKSFWDILNVAKKPLCASHSNCKSICDNDRNLTDDQISAIIKNGGVIGVNFFTKFLNNEVAKCSIYDIMKHVDHVLDLGGSENVGFGSDFDGVEFLPEGLAGVKDMAGLVDRIGRAGYSEDVVEGICGNNFLRLFGVCC
jgi:membrane dipeptidase